MSYESIRVMYNNNNWKRSDNHITSLTSYFEFFFINNSEIYRRLSFTKYSNVDLTVQCDRLDVGNSRGNDISDHNKMGVLGAVMMNCVVALLLVSSIWITCDADQKLHKIIAHVNSANVTWKVRDQDYGNFLIQK